MSSNGIKSYSMIDWLEMMYEHTSHVNYVFIWFYHIFDLHLRDFKLKLKFLL